MALFDNIGMFGGEPQVLVLLGPPGSGKGTQGVFLKEALEIPVISTGEILRAICASGTHRGESLRKSLASGGLVGDQIVNDLVAKRLEEPSCRRGFVLDGYPRTIAQAEFLKNLLNRLGLPQPIVLHFEASRRVLVNRVSGRRHCPSCGRTYNVFFCPPFEWEICDADGTQLAHRSDDSESVVLERLAVFEKSTAGVVDYYRSGNFHRIDASLAERQVRAQLRDILLSSAAVTV